jgi:hypothetical protein
MNSPPEANGFRQLERRNYFVTCRWSVCRGTANNLPVLATPNSSFFVMPPTLGTFVLSCGKLLLMLLRQAVVVAAAAVAVIVVNAAFAFAVAVAVAVVVVAAAAVAIVVAAAADVAVVVAQECT